MINTILVEDDLYIQKHFAERLKSNEIFKKGFSEYQNSNCNLTCRPAGIGTSKDRCSRQPVV